MEGYWVFRNYGSGRNYFLYNVRSDRGYVELSNGLLSFWITNDNIESVGYYRIPINKRDDFVKFVGSLRVRKIEKTRDRMQKLTEKYNL